MLRTDLARDATFQSRFRREAQAGSLTERALGRRGLRHRRGRASTARRVPYIVMEYVDGQTLRDLLRSGQRLMPRRALEIVDGVLAALDYSHRNGIIHRDVKPANVMLTPDGHGQGHGLRHRACGRRRVVDHDADRQRARAPRSTCPRSRRRAETVDARSDVYSAGCLLYELLGGRPPFIGESPVAVAYQHVREIPPPPSTFNPDVTPDADAIVMKALAKNPENRYQSAARDARRHRPGAGGDPGDGAAGAHRRRHHAAVGTQRRHCPRRQRSRPRPVGGAGCSTCC